MTSLIVAVVLFQVAAGVLFFGTRSSLAWFGTGSCPMPGGFVSGQKCLAVDANGVEVPWRGEIILPAGTASITDHAFFTGGKAIAGNYELQLVEDNGTCCTVYQTLDYAVSSTGATTPASSRLNDAVLTEAHTHHAVGTAGLVGYFLYISNPTTIPAGSDCQNTVSFLDANGVSLGSGTSGSGEKCNTPTPVPNTGALGGHIIDCTSGVAATGDIVPAGSIAVSGPMTRSAAPNPVAYAPVPSGTTYTETAAAPAGYHFVYDCPNPRGQSSAGQGGHAVASVAVPLQGTGEGWFYVVRDSGVLSAHLIDCTGGTAAPADLAGSTVAVTGGPVTEPAHAAPAQWSVPSGTYTVVGTAPAGYRFVECGHPGSTNTANIVVPAGGSGGVTFWVAHETGDLAGHIYDCQTAATTNEVLNGTLAAAGVTAAPVANPMVPAITVNTGTYAVAATAPAGYHFVACGANTTDSNTQAVTVPANGHAVAVFYVRHDTGDIAGHIYRCPNGKAGTDEVPGGTLAVAGVTAAPVANPMVPAINVNTGTYTVGATAPAGYHIVACGANQTNSGTESINVPVNGHGVAVFYVRKNPVVTPPSPGGGGQGAGTPPAAGGTQGVSTGSNPVARVAQAFAAVSGVKGAATLQPNTGRAELARTAIVSLVLLVTGAIVLLTNRRKRRA